MRVLFQMPYPGYLRMYGSTIRELAGRGHEVLIAYDRPDKRREAGTAAVETTSGVRVVASLHPAARRGWTPAARTARMAAGYLRYLEPRFADAAWLRDRMGRQLTGRLGALRRLPVMPRPLAWGAIRLLQAFDRHVIPGDPAVAEALRDLEVDAVVVTPLIARGPSTVQQTETVKAAREIGLPVAVGVSSWDHLTSKGLITVEPDIVLVWNEAQRREAIDLHRVPEGKVVATGAQLFDRWFALRPRTSGEEFCAALGLPAERPFVLYVGSSPNITAPEVEQAFVRRWVGALRASGDPALRELSVVVRPHPSSAEGWRDPDLGNLEDVVVFPGERPSIPMTAEDEARYFDSLHHSVAVVGVNTSAMIEASIVGRTVHTIEVDEFAATQGGTLHYHHLLPEGGGSLRVARSLDEHVGQLAETVRDPAAWRPRVEAFVRSFVRPHGLDRPATPIVADAIERLGDRACAR